MDRNASDKQVTKKITAKTDVDLIKNVLVLVPKIDSADEREPISPPPRPCCMRTIRIKRAQAMIWIVITKANIL